MKQNELLKRLVAIATPTKEYFNIRFREETGGGSSFASNYSSVNDVASFIATSDNTYITKIIFYIRFPTGSYSLGNFGGTSTIDVDDRMVLAKNVNSTITDITASFGSLTNFYNQADSILTDDDSTHKAFRAVFDFQNAPHKLDTGDKIFTDLKANFSSNHTIVIQAIGYIQN